MLGVTRGAVAIKFTQMKRRNAFLSLQKKDGCAFLLKRREIWRVCFFSRNICSSSRNIRFSSRNFRFSGKIFGLLAETIALSVRTLSCLAKTIDILPRIFALSSGDISFSLKILDAVGRNSRNGPFIKRYFRMESARQLADMRAS